MDYPDALPVILLYTEGRDQIEGATRIQKLVFLFQKENDADIDEVYRYEAGKYGPYSADLKGVLNSLEAEGLIERGTQRNSYGHEKYVYSLTLDGIQYAQELLEREEYDDIFDEMQQIKKLYNDWGLERLLKYVYRKYDRYATESDLDTDRLFDPEAGSVFADQTSWSVGGGDLQYREFIRNASTAENSDGTWRARDLDYGLTAVGDSRTEALNKLGEVIAATEGEAGHEPTDEELEELGIDPSQARDKEVDHIPDFMQ